MVAPPLRCAYSTIANYSPYILSQGPSFPAYARLGTLRPRSDTAYAADCAFVARRAPGEANALEFHRVDNRMWRMSSAPTSDWLSITENPLSPDQLSSWVIRPNCGAVVTFSGVVRDHSSSRENVIALEYETDAGLAQQRLRAVVDEARKRWPELERVAIHHRIGRV